MYKDILPIIKPDELKALHQTTELIIIDVSNGSAKEKYEAKHLDGALYVDLNTH